MDILLWRHAEAEDGNDDLQRKLTERGKKQADRVAAWIRRHAADDKLRIRVSPAVRTRQTADALALPYDTDRRLRPGAEATDLLAAAGWPKAGDAQHCVLLVGHQPTLGELAALLMTGSIAPWSVRKGALWWLSCRSRDGAAQTVLRAVVDPALL